MNPLHEEDDWDIVSSFDGSSSSVSTPATVANLDLGVADDYRGGNLFRGRRVILCGGSSRYSFGTKYGDYINRDGDEGQCDDDADEDYDYYDLDDELIPRNVSKKLKRDRMRKYGKRSFTKPGCIYGKYGLGTRFRG